MATQNMAINFAINCELHQYSGNNNESIFCPKCSFKIKFLKMKKMTRDALESNSILLY